MANALVVLQGSSLPLNSLQTLLSQHNVAADTSDITTDPTLCSTSGYGKALLVLSHADHAVLAAACKLLKPGADVVLHLPRVEQVGLIPSRAAAVHVLEVGQAVSQACMGFCAD